MCSDDWDNSADNAAVFSVRSVYSNREKADIGLNHIL